MSITEGRRDDSKSRRRSQCHISEFVFDYEVTQNSNHSVALEFMLKILITCQSPELTIQKDIKFEREMIQILSRFRIFENKTVSKLEVVTRNQYFEHKF